MREEKQHQFVCPDCGAGFDQKSRYERHRAASHPQPAPTSADVEKAVSGISFPAGRDELVSWSKQKGASDEIRDILRSLPDREYRDAAEVGQAFGEVKSHGRVHGGGEQPSVKGGQAAVRAAPSAAAVAKLLGGCRFPCSRDDLVRHARKNGDRVSDFERVMPVIERLPDREYRTMADVEKGVGASTGAEA